MKKIVKEYVIDNNCKTIKDIPILVLDLRLSLTKLMTLAGCFNKFKNRN